MKECWFYNYQIIFVMFVLGVERRCSHCWVCRSAFMAIISKDEVIYIRLQWGNVWSSRDSLGSQISRSLFMCIWVYSP